MYSQVGTILCLSLRSMQCGCLNTAPQTETHTGRPTHINIRPPSSYKLTYSFTLPPQFLFTHLSWNNIA